jgi:hypothetical protein
MSETDSSPSSSSTASGSGGQHDDKLGMKLRYNKTLRFGLNAAVTVSKLHLSADTDIRGGQIAGTPSVKLDGVKEVELSVAGGAANGLSDNVKVRVEVPANLYCNIPPSPYTLGLPLVISIRQRYMIETAFSSRNGTLEARGRWGISDVTGKPELQVKESILESLHGVGIGVSGVALAVAFVAGVGVGTPVASAGPYGKVVVAQGLTLGSVLALPLVRCKGASLTVSVGGGIGLSLGNGTWDALTHTLQKAGLPLGLDFKLWEHMETIFSRDQTIPDVPVCRG